MSAIIYKTGKDFSIPIVTVIDKKYVLIGPEYKKGISNCIKYEDFKPKMFSHNPKKYSCNDRCLDFYEAVKDNFVYFGDLDEKHLLGCLALYAEIATKCGTRRLIPDVLSGLFEFKDDITGINIFVAKFLQEKVEEPRKIREWYFTQLSMEHKSLDLIINPKVGLVLVTPFVPGILKYHVIVDQKQFNSMVVNLANTIEKNTKYLNFLHGSTHIGHVSVDGKMIDFGESVNIYDKRTMPVYLEKYLPLNMKKKAIEKYKIQDLDVGCACTLVELHTFFESILDNLKKCESLNRFKKTVIEMNDWILELLKAYFDNIDLSIFTMTKNSYKAIFGGFEEPHSPSPINEIFPTQYFLEEFDLIKQANQLT